MDLLYILGLSSTDMPSLTALIVALTGLLAAVTAIVKAVSTVVGRIYQAHIKALLEGKNAELAAKDARIAELVAAAGEKPAP